MTTKDEEPIYSRKKIVICSDGTSNTAYRDGPLTNVSRISRCITSEDGSGIPQVLLYQTGIGTALENSWLLNSFKRGLGLGVDNRIIEAYAFICHNYRSDKDDIVLIGFSRGAFIMRCVADLISKVGVLRKNGLYLLPAVFHAWRNGLKDPLSADWRMTQEKSWFRSLADSTMVSLKQLTGRKNGKITISEPIQVKLNDIDGRHKDVKIKACALWDTVSSLGIPLPSIFRQPTSTYLTFVDSNLHGIEQAYQALAIHERRWNFPSIVWKRPKSNRENQFVSNENETDIREPLLNDENNERLGDESAEVREASVLKQCWFMGYHADVGGGKRNDALGHIALAWIAGNLDPILSIDWDLFWEPRFNEGSSWSTNNTGSTARINIKSSMTWKYWMMGSRFRIPRCQFFDSDGQITRHNPDENRSEEEIHPTVRYLLREINGTRPMSYPPALFGCSWPNTHLEPWKLNHPKKKSGFEVGQSRLDPNEEAILLGWLQKDLRYLQFNSTRESPSPRTVIPFILAELGNPPG